MPAALAAVGLALALSLGAPPSPQDAQEHARALEEFELLALEAPPGRMPRLGEPRAAAALAVLSDERRYLAEPFPQDRLDRALDLCGRATR